MEEYKYDTDGMASEDDVDNDSDEEFTVKTQKAKRSSGKSKPVNRGFKKEWLDLFPWVEEDPEDSKFAICRACNQKMKAQKGILETHQKTKKHLKNLSGSDDIDDEEEEVPAKKIKLEPKINIPSHQSILEQGVTEDQMSFFSEAPMDSAHHAITDLIDKLVEKYHDNRVQNLKVQNQVRQEMHTYRADMRKDEMQRNYERNLQREMYKKRELEIHLSLKQQQHETRIAAMEEERDAKLKAVEQQLVYARQEYEKKVRLLDQQLQFIK